ncbi:MAG: YgiQ family radical SAM protein, partial [Planctomycetota bacterium]|nr:YgiQ family radical SAM protein [Planctomycetota bacterium]
EIARRLSRGEDAQSIDDVRGTVVRRGDLSSVTDCVEAPSFEEVAVDRPKFCEAVRIFLGELNPWTARTLVQKSSGQYVVQLPPPLPISGETLDSYYELPYCRAPHPAYASAGGVPGFETVSGTITTHRGCFGGCSFCALHAHQGKVVVSRSVASLVREASRLAACGSFHGIITDAGGPTANMYGLGCKDQTARSKCRRSSCLMPNVCRNLRTDHRDYLEALAALKGVKGVRHVFAATGIRFDLALADSSGRFIEEVCRHHVGGQMKLAPEHSVDGVLAAMNKPGYEIYERFMKEYSATNLRLGLKQYQVEYYMSGHPGCSVRDMAELSSRLKARGISPRQAQAFTPTPMTLSTCMYHTGINPLTGKEVYVPKSARERREQLALMQWKSAGRGGFRMDGGC